MPAASAAILASLALAGITRYTASLSTQARYYTDSQAVQPFSGTALEVEPRLGLEHEEQSVLFSVAYFPRLVMVFASPPPQFFNQASLSLALRPDPLLKLTASASGCYGTNDFRVQYALACGAPALATGPAPGPQPVPSVATVKYLSATGTLRLESRLSARTAVTAMAWYLVQGGGDAPTRMALPLQRGPSFLALLEWAIDGDDALATSVSGSYSSFLREGPAPEPTEPPGSPWIAQLLEVWQRALGGGGRLRLGLGVGATGTSVELPRLVLRRTAVVGEIDWLQPLGSGQEMGPPQLSAGARVAPFVDGVSGLAYERAEVSTGLGWPLGREWRLEARLSAGIALEGPQRGQETSAAHLAATWIAARWLRLSAGLDGFWQEPGRRLLTRSFHQVGVVLGATLKEEGRL